MKQLSHAAELKGSQAIFDAYTSTAELHIRVQGGENWPEISKIY